MAVIKQLDKIKNWLETEICSQFKFKQADDDNVDATYPYELVNPNVFILYSFPWILTETFFKSPIIITPFIRTSCNYSP